MNPIPRPLLFLIALFIAFGPGFAQDRALSVQEAVEMALAKSPDLEAARAQLAQARADLNRARSAYQPQLGLGMDYLRGDAPSAFLVRSIDSRSLPPGTNFNQPGRFGSFGAGLDLSLPLWDAGVRDLSTRQARTGVALREEGRRALESAWIHQVIQAYFDQLSAQEAIPVAEESLATVQSQLSEARTRHRLGGALKADVLSLEVRQAEAEQGKIEAQNGFELAAAALARLVLADPSKKVEISGEEWNPATLPETFAEALALARLHRAELKVAALRLDVAELGRKKARASWKPRADLMARHWVQGGTLSDLELGRDNWTVGAALRVPLSQGARRAERDKALEAKREAKARVKAITLGVELEVRQAFLGLEAARARDRVAKANVARAEEGLRLVQSQFQGGAVTVTRYLQAEADRTRARVLAIRSRAEVKKSKAQLGHAVGLCTPRRIQEGGRP